MPRFQEFDFPRRLISPVDFPLLARTKAGILCMWMGHPGGRIVMSRILILAATAVFFAAQMLGSARASAVTYDLTLKDTFFGPESGTGTLTVDGPIVSGLEIFTSASGGGLNSLSFLI